MIDHINGDRADNKWNNLREASHAQIKMNKPRQANNKSGAKGVYANRRKNRWVASICLNRKTKYLGSFKTLEEASTAYAVAAKFHFGDFARVNDF